MFDFETFRNKLRIKSAVFIEGSFPLGRCIILLAYSKKTFITVINVFCDRDEKRIRLPLKFWRLLSYHLTNPLYLPVVSHNRLDIYTTESIQLSKIMAIICQSYIYNAT